MNQLKEEKNGITIQKHNIKNYKRIPAFHGEKEKEFIKPINMYFPGEKREK